MTDRPAIGIVGLGTMGLGIAQVYAQAGFPVVATDAHAPARDSAHSRMAETLNARITAGKLTEPDRDATLSRAFGVGAVMDAFTFGFMVPNLFRRLFGEGALSASFLPIYARLDRDDPPAARRFAALTIVLLAGALNIIVVAAEIVLAVMHANSAHDDTLSRLGLELLMTMLPYMPLVCIVAILGSVLQTHDRFGPTAASPLILNLAIVGSCLGFLRFFAGDDLAGLGTGDEPVALEAAEQARHGALGQTRRGDELGEGHRLVRAQHVDEQRGGPVDGLGARGGGAHIHLRVVAITWAGNGVQGLVLGVVRAPESTPGPSFTIWNCCSTSQRRIRR